MTPIDGRHKTMIGHEERYSVVSILLQAERALTLDEVARPAGHNSDTTKVILNALVSESLVVQGELDDTLPGTRYVWSARWVEREETRATKSREKLRETVEALPEELDVDTEAVVAFNRYVLEEYQPPADKRLLVFLQCSVRRPFSKSPSHASMRRAIAVATGYDPAREFERCPVHVVVLASNIGPVPYELEDVYPANVRGGGVKHFEDGRYERVKPVLAERLASYLTRFGSRYDRIAGFTDGRYADVLREAQRIARIGFPVFPKRSGPVIASMSGKRARTHWEKCWVQLYDEVVGWLPAVERTKARARFDALNVEPGVR